MTDPWAFRLAQAFADISDTTVRRCIINSSSKSRAVRIDLVRATTPRCIETRPRGGIRITEDNSRSFPGKEQFAEIKARSPSLRARDKAVSSLSSFRSPPTGRPCPRIDLEIDQALIDCEHGRLCLVGGAKLDHRVLNVGFDRLAAAYQDSAVSSAVFPRPAHLRTSLSRSVRTRAGSAGLSRSILGLTDFSTA